MVVVTSDRRWYNDNHLRLAVILKIKIYIIWLSKKVKKLTIILPSTSYEVHCS